VDKFLKISVFHRDLCERETGNTNRDKKIDVSRSCPMTLGHRLEKDRFTLPVKRSYDLFRVELVVVVCKLFRNFLDNESCFQSINLQPTSLYPLP
jgi:hypothetical protein